ncbi:MAG: response regulator [Lagierella massiliensis]|nr:response regulator [Lagierella massiliensis]
MIRILLVEDETLELEYLSYIISNDKNMEVVGLCNNGRDAVRMAKQLSPDLVILDISMPLKNGIEAGRQIKEFNPNIKIILNSAYSEFEYAKNALKYGFNDYLVKPTEESKIISTIRNLFDEDNKLNLGLSNSILDRQKLVDTINKFCNNLLNNSQCEGLKNITLLSSLISKQLNYQAKMTYVTLLLISIESSLRSVGHTDESLDIYGHLFTFLDDELTYANLKISLQKICEESFKLRSKDSFSIPNVKNFIENNFTNPDLGLYEISSVFYINKSYLSRLFKEEEKITVSDFIENLRLNRALELIDKTNLKISDIWQMSGFKNKQQFYRSFNSKFNNTPLERRDKNDKFHK